MKQEQLSDYEKLLEAITILSNRLRHFLDAETRQAIEVLKSFDAQPHIQAQHATVPHEKVHKISELLKTRFDKLKEILIQTNDFYDDTVALRTDSVTVGYGNLNSSSKKVEFCAVRKRNSINPLGLAKVNLSSNTDNGLPRQRHKRVRASSKQELVPAAKKARVDKGKTIPSKPWASISDPRTNLPLPFNIFSTSYWMDHVWRTTFFMASREQRTFADNYMLSTIQNYTLFTTLSNFEQNLLLCLAKEIDSFLAGIRLKPIIIPKLNDCTDLGYDTQFVLHGFMLCVLFDRICWSLGLSVQQNPIQQLDPLTASDTPLRDWACAKRSLQAAVLMTETFSQLEEKGQEQEDRQCQMSDSKAAGSLEYKATAVGLVYYALGDANRIIGNMCFACVAILLFCKGTKGLIDWEKTITDSFASQKDPTSEAYLKKLRPMMGSDAFTYWKLWYRWLAVCPTDLLQPNFLQTDRRTPAGTSPLNIIKANERFGRVPKAVWDIEQVMFRTALRLMNEWHNQQNDITLRLHRKAVVHVEAFFKAIQDNCDVDDSFDIPISASIEHH